MAKKKKVTQEDLKKFFEKSKKRLQQLGGEAKIWMKKGEVELSRLSKMGKLELDVVNLNVKKEKLFRDIGKKMVEQDLGKEISNSAVKSMCTKAKSIIDESKKKNRIMSKIRKGLLKGKPAQSKNKK